MAGCVAAFAAADTAFRFWLFFPGFFQFSDWMAETLPGSVYWQSANHIQVLFISFALKVLYAVLGYHTWYILFLNLVLWNGGLAAIVLAVYRTTSSRHALWLLLLTFFPGIWFYVPLYWKDFTFGLLLWLASGMCLLATTFRGPRSTNERTWRDVYWATLAVVLFCALYWRHNAIVSVAPLCLYLTHKFVIVRIDADFGTLRYLARVGVGFAAICGLLIILVVAHPALLGKPGYKARTHHILLHDIVAISVITGEDLIPKDAYLPGVTFADVRAIYLATPDNVDALIFKPNKVLDPWNSKRITEIWADSVCRHPVAFLRHKGLLAKSLLLKQPWLPTARDLEADMEVTWKDRDWFTRFSTGMMAHFPPRERKITFTPTRLAICARARSWTSATNPRVVWYLGISVTGLILGGMRLVRKVKKGNCSPACDRVVLSQCLFLAAVATIAVVIAFAPHTSYRYVFPAVTTSIAAAITLALGLRSPRRKQA